MKYIISIFLLFFFFLIGWTGMVFAQNQFQCTIGGGGDDEGLSIVQTTGGGYAIAGSTRSFGAGYDDIYIVKLNANGTLQWSKTIGGPSANGDIGWSIIQTFDGGFAVAGFIGSSGSSTDLYIVKLDINGSIQWNKTVGGSSYDYGRSIIQTSDGGYAVAGITSSFGAGGDDMFIVRFDSEGNVQWSRTIGGTGNDYAFSIVQSTDGGFAIAGTTYSFGAGNGDVYIVKLDANGSLLWNRTIGGTSTDEAYSIVQTTDGGYITAGTTLSYGAGITDEYIVKLNTNGDLQWTRVIGGTSYDDAYSIIKTQDGGYITVGYTQSFGAGFYDIYIVKLDSIGSLQWSRTVGGTNYEFGYSIIQTSDSGFAIGGITKSFGAGNYDMYIVKLSANGNACGNSTSPVSFFGTGGSISSPTPTITFPNLTITTLSPTISSGGILNTLCLVGIQPISNEIPDKFYIDQNYPNPFNPSTNIKFQVPNRQSQVFLVKMTVYDVIGKEIAILVNQQLAPGSYEVIWNASDYPSGLYFYKIEIFQAKSSTNNNSYSNELTNAENVEFTETKKMILIK